MKTRLAARPLLFLLLPLLPLLAGGCKQVTEIITPSLPPATQEGKDTFGCMLDGHLWLPSREHTLDDILEGDVTPAGNLVLIKAEDNFTPANFWLRLSTTGARLQPGTYALGQGFEPSFETYKGGYTTYVAGAGDQGTLTITKFEQFSRTTTVGGQTSTVKGAIVSGTFSFTATDGSGRRITVTDGRFDLNAYE